MTDASRASLYANDLQALAAMMQDRSSLANMLSTIHMPCLIFAGEADPDYHLVQKCAMTLPNSTFLPLPQCDHIAAIGRSELVLPNVQTFLAKNRK